MPNLVACCIGVQQHIACPSIRGWWVAQAAQVDHMPATNPPVQGLVGMADTYEVSFTPFQASLDHVVVHVWYKTLAIIVARRGMYAEEPCAARQLYMQLKRQALQPIQPSGGGERS